MSAGDRTFEREGLLVQILDEPDTARIVWSGVSETQDPELGIGMFLKEALPDLAGKKVVVDFRELDYMNSATTLTVLQFVRELSARGLQTELRYNPAAEWQRIAFRSLKTVTQTLPTVHIVGDEPQAAPRAE
jgi:hypothetical protein